MTPHGPMRWYNPTLEAFEWREVPKSDEHALKAMEDAPHSPVCTRTYQEWRRLGASIRAALTRAGEAAKERGERQEHDGEDDGEDACSRHA